MKKKKKTERERERNDKNKITRSSSSLRQDGVVCETLTVVLDDATMQNNSIIIKGKSMCQWADDINPMYMLITRRNVLTLLHRGVRSCLHVFNLLHYCPDSHFVSKDT